MLVAKVLEVDLSIPSSVKEKFVKKRWFVSKYHLFNQYQGRKFRSICLLPHLLKNILLFRDFPSISSTIWRSSSELLSGLMLFPCPILPHILDFLLRSRYGFKGELIYGAPIVITFFFYPILFLVHFPIFSISLSSSLLSSFS